ncbi:MAG TPA: hypothetical protein VN515_02580 [Terriglobales bacterium]|nr:hypothetical protein [Terriglobales bacterium]
MPRGIIFAALLALTIALGAQNTAGAANPAAAASQPGQALADSVEQALNGLQTSLAAVDPDSLHASKSDKQAVAEGQASIQRNLKEAVPELLEAFRATPDDAGVAFRLYRDLDAVLGSAEAVAAQGGSDTNLDSSTAAVRSRLNQLGDWIESRGSSNYASLQSLKSTAAAAASQPKPAPQAPSTLVINDANGSAPAASKKTSKKPAPKPGSPATCCR